MAVAVRASILAAAAIAAVASARAQSEDGHTHLIPLPHPEILHPNEPSLPPGTLHPHVYHAPPHQLPRHQHLIPLPHPELLHPRPLVSYGSGFIMTATLRTDAGEPISAPANRDGEVDQPRDVPGRLIACWQPPPLGDDATHEVTVRMEFARDGSIIGKPMVTYVKTGPGNDARHAMVDSIQAALQHCTPLDFAPGLGAAIAGYPFAIRFILAHGDAMTTQHTQHTQH
jgi:hypothetical protein